MTKVVNGRPEKAEEVRRFLEVPDCKCPIRRLHTDACHEHYTEHTKECNENHVAICFFGLKHCDCVRKCGCPRRPEHKRRCDCLLNWQDKCPHVLSVKCGMDLDEWRAFLVEFWPDDHETPDFEPRPAVIVTRAARVAALQVRYSEGRYLWTTLDRFQVGCMGQQAVKVPRGNGRPKYGEVRRA